MSGRAFPEAYEGLLTCKHWESRRLAGCQPRIALGCGSDDDEASVVLGTTRTSGRSNG